MSFATTAGKPMGRDAETTRPVAREIGPNEAALIAGGRSEGGCIIPPKLADLLNA